MKSQREQVLKYMELYGSITQADAVSCFHCYRLGARIFELKEQGIPIQKKTETVKRPDGTYYSFARYSIMKEAETSGN